MYRILSAARLEAATLGHSPGSCRGNPVSEVVPGMCLEAGEVQRGSRNLRINPQMCELADNEENNAGSRNQTISLDHID